MPEEIVEQPLQLNGRHRPDQPLTDRAADKLGWYSFAESVARSIVETPHREAMVYGIRGPWGSGKTTVLNFIRKELELTGNRSNNQKDRASFTVIDFNPWWFSGSGDILGQLLVALARGIGQKEPKVAKLLKKYLLFINPVAKATVSLLPGSSIWQKLLGLLSDVLEAVIQRLGRPSDPHELKKKITADLASKAGGNRYLMFIDDLDRLQPPELLQVFQAIKAVADFPAMTYVLAYDNAVAAAAIEQAGYRDPESYLRKIVQVPIDLPPVSPLLLQRYFEDVVVKPLQNDRWSQADWEQYGLPLLSESIGTPRDVIRVYNAVIPRYFGVKDSVDPLQYLILHWVRCQYPELNKWIEQMGIPSLSRNNPELREGFPEDFRNIRPALGAIFSQLNDPVRYRTFFGPEIPLSTSPPERGGMTIDADNVFTYLYSCKPPMAELRGAVAKLLKENPRALFEERDAETTRMCWQQVKPLLDNESFLETLSDRQRNDIAFALGENADTAVSVLDPQDIHRSVAIRIARLLRDHTSDGRAQVDWYTFINRAPLSVSAWLQRDWSTSGLETPPSFGSAFCDRALKMPIKEKLTIRRDHIGLVLLVLREINPGLFATEITNRLDSDDELCLWYYSAKAPRSSLPEFQSNEGLTKVLQRLDAIPEEIHGLVRWDLRAEIRTRIESLTPNA